MSTWMYLTCLNHDPVLVAEDESGQHHYDLPRIRAEIADRSAVVEETSQGQHWDEPINSYFRRRSAQFLRQHKTCRIGIRDEYGVDYPTEENQST